MMVQPFLIIFVLAIILSTLGIRFYEFCVFVRKMNKIPGPSFGLPFFGVKSHMTTIAIKDRLEWRGSLARKFEDGLFSLLIGTSGHVDISKPEHVKVILRSNIEVNKPMAFKHIKQWFEDGISIVPAPKWYRIRKVVAPVFQLRLLGNFTEVMIEKITKMTEYMDREIEIQGDKPIDLFGLCNRIVTDIISASSTGGPLGSQAHPDEYESATKIITSSFGERMIRPWLAPDFIFFRSAIGKKSMDAIQRAHHMIVKRIETKQRERVEEFDKSDLSGDNKIQGTRKRKTILDLLLEANEGRTNPLTKPSIRDQMTSIMIVGKETSVSLMTWALFCVGVELDVQRKVQEELDEIIGDADDKTTLERIPNLKYLERVIKEVLRMYPSIAAIARELVDDLKIGDYTVPKGAVLNIQIYHLHRDPSTWPDPLRFDPDRFLPENLKNRHPFAYIPFSAGPRNCPGLKWAMLEAKIAVVQVLRKFNIRSIENHYTVQKMHQLTLKPLGGVFVHVEKRSDR